MANGTTPQTQPNMTVSCTPSRVLVVISVKSANRTRIYSFDSNRISRPDLNHLRSLDRAGAFNDPWAWHRVVIDMRDTEIGTRSMSLLECHDTVVTLNYDYEPRVQ